MRRAVHAARSWHAAAGQAEFCGAHRALHAAGSELAALHRLHSPVAPPSLHSFAARGSWPSSARHYAKMSGGAAKGYTPPAANAVGASQGGSLRAVYFSPNVIAEPYRGTPQALPLSSLFTLSGWKTRWTRVLGKMKNVYTLAKVRKDLPEFSLSSFKAMATEMHREICGIIAAGEGSASKHDLQKCLTEAVYTDIRRELRARSQGGWARVAWSLDSMDDVSVVHARLMAPNPKDTSLAFAQLTVEFCSTQRFEAFDARNKRVAGDAATPVKVIEHWVFERPIGTVILPGGMQRWRLAARLSVNPQGT